MPGLLDREKLVNNALDRLDRLERRMADAEKVLSVRVFQPLIGEEGELGLRAVTAYSLAVGLLTGPVEKFHVVGEDGQVTAIKVEGLNTTLGGQIILQSKNDTPADDDVGGNIRCFARNSANLETLVGEIYFQLNDVTEGTEDTSIIFATQDNAVDVFPLAMRGARVGINDTTPTTYLDIDQGADDGGILALKSSDVAHGVTTRADTDTYALFRKTRADNGGLQVEILADGGADRTLNFEVTQGANATTTKSTGGHAIAEIDCQLASGTGTTSVNAGGNLFAVADANSVRMILDAEGDLHLDATSNPSAWDEYDDMALLNGFRAAMVPDGHYLQKQFGHFIEDAKEILERTGVVTFNDDGHHFIAMKKWNMLLTDTLRQLHERTNERVSKIEEQAQTINKQQKQIDDLVSRMMVLEAGQ